MQKVEGDMDDDSLHVEACNMELKIVGPPKSHLEEKKYSIDYLLEDKIENQKEELSKKL